MTLKATRPWLIQSSSWSHFFVVIVPQYLINLLFFSICRMWPSRLRSIPHSFFPLRSNACTYRELISRLRWQVCLRCGESKAFYLFTVTTRQTSGDFVQRNRLLEILTVFSMRQYFSLCYIYYRFFFQYRHGIYIEIYIYRYYYYIIYVAFFASDRWLMFGSVPQGVINRTSVGTV